MTNQVRLVLAAALLLVSYGCSPPSEKNQESKVSTSTSPYRVSLSADGSTIVFTSSENGRRHVYRGVLTDSEVSQQQRLSDETKISGWPAISSDGKSVVFASQDTKADAANLFVGSLTGNGLAQITDTDFFDTAPAFSADGSTIAFVRAHRSRDYSMGGKIWDQWDVYTIDKEGKHETRLTEQNYDSVSAPYFLGSSGQIVFSADHGKDSTIFVLKDVETKEEGTSRPVPKALADPSDSSNLIGADPFPSPDGTALVFVSKRVSRPSPFDYELWTIGVDGTGLKQVTSSQSFSTSPVWSSKDDIFFLSDPERDGRFELRRVSLGGTDERVMISEGQLE